MARGVAEPPLVEITAPPDLLFPFELLPVAGFPTDEPVGNRLEQTASQFLAFAAVVRRRWLVELGEHRPLRRDIRGLTVAMFRDAELDGAGEEQRFFTDDPRIDLQLVWPDREFTAKDAIRMLSRRLVEPRRLELSGPADDIQHFACHCSTEGTTLDWRLKLRPEDGEAVRVPLKSYRRR